MAVVDILYEQKFLLNVKGQMSNEDIGSLRNPWQNPPWTFLTFWLVSGIIEILGLVTAMCSIFVLSVVSPYLHVALSPYP